MGQQYAKAVSVIYIYIFYYKSRFILLGCKAVLQFTITYRTRHAMLTPQLKWYNEVYNYIKQNNFNIIIKTEK